MVFYQFYASLFHIAISMQAMASQRNTFLQGLGVVVSQIYAIPCNIGHFSNSFIGSKHSKHSFSVHLQ